MKESSNIILLTSLVFLISSCSLLSPPIAPDCEEDLVVFMLESVDFPIAWERGRLHYDDELNMGADNSCFGSFYVEGGSAFHIVLEFSSDTEAIDGYSLAIDRISSTDKLSTTPEYKGAASDYNISCSIQNEIHRCLFVGRYGRYVAVFHTHMDKEYMTERGYEEILSKIDKRMLNR